MIELCRWRAQIFAQVEELVARSSKAREEALIGQAALFDMGEVRGRVKTLMAAGGAGGGVEDWPEHTLLANEKEVLGFYMSGHPLARYRKELKSYTTHTLANLPQSGIVRVAGMIINTKKTITKTGRAMARFKLEDLEGEAECVVFPNVYKPDVAKFLVSHEMVVVKGKLEPRADFNDILVEEVTPLKEARARLVKRVVLNVATAALEEEPIARVQKICEQHPGKCHLIFRLQTATHGEYALMTHQKVEATDGFLHEVEKVLGRGCWELLA